MLGFLMLEKSKPAAFFSEGAHRNASFGMTSPGPSKLSFHQSMTRKFELGFKD